MRFSVYVFMFADARTLLFSSNSMDFHSLTIEITITLENWPICSPLHQQQQKIAKKKMKYLCGERKHLQQITAHINFKANVYNEHLAINVQYVLVSNAFYYITLSCVITFFLLFNLVFVSLGASIYLFRWWFGSGLHWKYEDSHG